jgi:tetratricopeptide (TPR) repeat protein
MAALGLLHVLQESCGKDACRRIIPYAISMIIVLLSLATIMRNGVWQDKIFFWRDVVSKSPGKARAHRSLGGNLVELGKLEEAAREYAIAAKLQPAYTDAYIGLGTVAMGQNRAEDALEYFNVALSLEPGNVKIYKYLSDVFLVQGRLDDARGALLRALAVEPAVYDVHNNLGVIYEMEGKLVEALREYRLELQSNPENHEILSKIVRLEQQKRADID